MADPVTAGIGMAANLAGGVVGAMGAEYSAKAEAAMHNYRAGVAELDAKLKAQDRDYVLQSTGVEVGEKGMEVADIRNRTIAGYAAGNIDPTRGSAAAVTQSETKLGQQAQQIIAAGGQKKAYALDVERAQDIAQAGAERFGAKTALETGDLTAISTILGSVGGVSSKWLQASRQGTFA